MKPILGSSPPVPVIETVEQAEELFGRDDNMLGAVREGLALAAEPLRAIRTKPLARLRLVRQVRRVARDAVKEDTEEAAAALMDARRAALEAGCVPDDIDAATIEGAEAGRAGETDPPESTNDVA